MEEFQVASDIGMLAFSGQVKGKGRLYNPHSLSGGDGGGQETEGFVSGATAEGKSRNGILREDEG